MPNENSSAPLLPCPFCGGEADIQSGARGMWNIAGCKDVKCSGFRASGWHDSPNDASAAWNVRVPQAVEAQAPAAVAVPASWADSEDDRPTSRADLERVMDTWNDTTGALPKDSGWRCEVLGMLHDAYDLGAHQSGTATTPAPSAKAVPAAFAVPPQAITANLMRDDSGEQPAYCLMAAYRSEDDARAALAVLATLPDAHRDEMTRMVDAAMVATANISPALRRNDCQRVISAALAVNPQALQPRLAISAGDRMTLLAAAGLLAGRGYRDSSKALQRVLEAAPQAQPAFQQRVQPWMMECFGAEIAADRIERNHRFLEEALELVQATGCTQSEAHQLVDYVFGRPVGEPAQEVGGVMVTLAALCLANGLDMHQAGETELARVWTKVEAIRAKQAAKPKHSPLPQAQPADALDAERLGDRLPMQPVIVSPDTGVRRFKENRIVTKLVSHSELTGYSLNEIARDFAQGMYSADEQMQLAQLIGYSVDGYGTLSYVTDESYERAAAMAAAQEGGNAAKEA